MLFPFMFMTDFNFLCTIIYLLIADASPNPANQQAVYGFYCKCSYGAQTLSNTFSFYVHDRF